ncbi:MAG: ATP-binding protein [Deltaproteobacteria bacterium]|nr:ATP-binding protein [Deltaproteobacteria bacterium]
MSRESGSLLGVAGYLRRTVDRLLGELLAELPAVLIVGPRAAGKTTTAERHAATTIHLDRPAEAAAFRADPDAALRGLLEPTLLDEWQSVPEVLGAVKRAIDVDPHPGRYILTGSVRADLDAETWPGTGRLVRVAMYPMTVAEQLGRLDMPPLFDRLAAGEVLGVPAAPPDLRGYVELALESGFPQVALGMSASARQHWIDSYVDQLLTRDAQQIDGGRDPLRLRRYFEAYALNSAGVVDDKTLYQAAGINRKTALAYERLLANLMVVDLVPAWTSNRLKRLVLSGKRFLVDPALLAGVLRVDAGAVLRDGNLLGRVLDTFVAAHLRAELAIARTRPRLYHLRQEQGRREVDLLGELGAERIIAVEIKADSGPGREAARHLAWLRDELGDRFVAGVVLHTGPRVYPLGERITAAPIGTLWA